VAWQGSHSAARRAQPVGEKKPRAAKPKTPKAKVRARAPPPPRAGPAPRHPMAPC